MIKPLKFLSLCVSPAIGQKSLCIQIEDDVDPVGACVGMKGVRIQSVVRELEGEKIDILKYESDPRTFITNALSPADVDSVILLDEAKRQALGVVDESQLSLAIGKRGLNVRLANRLVDWNIDVKTPEQFAELDIAVESKRAVSALFGEIEEEEITSIGELPDIPPRIVDLLKANDIELIENLIGLTDEDLEKLNDLTEEDVLTIRKIIDENIEVIEEEEGTDSVPLDEEQKDVAVTEDADDEDEEDVYECPECSSDITINMTACPNCGVGLSFEFEESEETEEED